MPQSKLNICVYKFKTLRKGEDKMSYIKTQGGQNDTG